MQYWSLQRCKWKIESEASKGLRSALTRQLQICIVGSEYHSLHFITFSERSVISSSPCVWPGALNTCNLREEGPNEAVHWSPAFFFGESRSVDQNFGMFNRSPPILHFGKIECGCPMRKRHVSKMTLKAGYLTQNPPVDQSEPAPTNAPTWMDSAWTCFIAPSSMSIHPIFSIGFLFLH